VTGRTWLRLGLLLLAVFQGMHALWAALWPRAFYTGYPTRDRAWLTLFPPFNEHLVRDFGLMSLPFTGMLVYAAVSGEFRVVRATLLTALLFFVPHLVYHQSHVVEGTDTGIQFASQATPVLLIALLLAVNQKVRLRAPLRRPD
jgi:hypothetical protein